MGFVTAPHFRWTEHNKKVWNSFGNAVRSGRSLAKAVQTFQTYIVTRAGRLSRFADYKVTGGSKAAFGRTFQEMIRSADVTTLRDLLARGKEHRTATAAT